jgi:hypothetical protein
LSNKFGEEIGRWMKLLTDIKKSRATFDTSETKKEFGPGERNCVFSTLKAICRRAQIFVLGYIFHGIIFDKKNGLAFIEGDFFTNSSGHPALFTTYVL